MSTVQTLPVVGKNRIVIGPHQWYPTIILHHSGYDTALGRVIAVGRNNFVQLSCGDHATWTLLHDVPTDKWPLYIHPASFEALYGGFLIAVGKDSSNTGYHYVEPGRDNLAWYDPVRYRIRHILRADPKQRGCMSLFLERADAEFGVWDHTHRIVRWYVSAGIDRAWVLEETDTPEPAVRLDIDIRRDADEAITVSAPEGKQILLWPIFPEVVGDELPEYQPHKFCGVEFMANAWYRWRQDKKWVCVAHLVGQQAIDADLGEGWYIIEDKKHG